MSKVPTPKIDKMLETFTLKTQEGKVLNNTVVQGQKEIGECILNRKAPDGKNKVHAMAHTRYGKSIIVGATVSIRAAIKKEKWAIVAPTKEQAQIIMDYVLYFSVNDPIISQLLKTDAKILREERLTQRRSRDHITFLNGGEIRTFSAKQVMGFGAQNIVMDEAGLIEDSDEAKAFRMLGDNPKDFFIIKIGNPFNNNHFKQSYLDDSYYHINIDAKRGLEEGRLSQEILDEQKNKPHYDILYNNIFPDNEGRDKNGYLPLLSHKIVTEAQVDMTNIVPLGDRLVGVDPNDGGENEGVIGSRYMNLFRIDQAIKGGDPLSIADDAANIHDAKYIYVDKQGVGSGTAKRLQGIKETKLKTVAINAGEKITKDDKLPDGENPSQYLNQRAYIYWQTKLWIEGGGKIPYDPELVKQLLAIKYKNSSSGAIQIIPKDLLRKPYYNIHDLGRADVLSFTFSPKKPRVFIMPQDGGNAGIQPYYPDIGI